MRCLVTAIAPDGRRTSCEVEAASLFRAVFAYNYRAVSDTSLIRPLPDNGTVFEVVPEGREALRVTWAQAWAWANRETEPVNSRKARTSSSSRRARVLPR